MGELVDGQKVIRRGIWVMDGMGVFRGVMNDDDRDIKRTKEELRPWTMGPAA